MTDHEFQRGVCRSCKADILWAVTEPGCKPIPLDARPLVTLVPIGGDRVQTRRAYQSHWATCPNAKEHRK
jgi:hypothetical protein